jgi:hypothetical protein
MAAVLADAARRLSARATAGFRVPARAASLREEGARLWEELSGVTYGSGGKRSASARSGGSSRGSSSRTACWCPWVVRGGSSGGSRGASGGLSPGHLRPEGKGALRAPSRGSRGPIPSRANLRNARTSSAVAGCRAPSGGSPNRPPPERSLPRGPAPANYSPTSRRPSKARPRVTSSAYSRSPPTGSPDAKRVTRSPNGASIRDR